MGVLKFLRHNGDYSPWYWPWSRLMLRQDRRVLEVLSALSYRADELDSHLHTIACNVSQLLGIDWSVVTLCHNSFERLLASSIDLGEGEHTYPLHGLLTEKVVQSGCSLVVENTQANLAYGKGPEGYRAYLGVPLRTSQGETIGTICSFHKRPRRFTREEVRIAELFAERAATAIDNYHLYQQQRQFSSILEAQVEERTQELYAAQTKLLEQERLAAIGEFAATIVHEIRNPLTTVLMGLNYFKRTDLSAPAQARLSLALDEAGRLERLLKEILHYAKPQELQLEKLDVNEFLTAMMGLMKDMPEAVGQQLQFVPAPIPVTVMADRDKLKQVLINVGRNACEAVGAGEQVQWSVKSVNAGVQSERVCICVQNGGKPIPPEVLPRLTEAFYTTKSSGTGLGLAIVKRIVEAHSGTLSIQSSVSAGTTVRIELPCAECGVRG